MYNSVEFLEAYINQADQNLYLAKNLRRNII